VYFGIIIPPVVKCKTILYQENLVTSSDDRDNYYVFCDRLGTVMGWYGKATGKSKQ
jgi:hypothetical protein